MANPWQPLSSIQQTLLDKNLSVLEKQQADVSEVIRSHTNRADILLKRGPGGIYGCQYNSRDHFISVHSEAPRQEEIQGTIQTIQNAFANGAWLVVLMAPAMGIVLPQVVQYLEQKHPGEPKGLLCLEMDPGLLCAGLSVYDFSPILQTGRILFSFGPNLVNATEQVMTRHHLETLDPSQLAYLVGSRVNDSERQQDYSFALQKIKEIHQHKRQQYFALLKEAEQKWSKPIKAINKVWTHITDDRAAGAILKGLADGFDDAGIESHYIQFRDKLFTRFFRAAYDFYEKQPDLILCINHSSNYVSSFAQQIPIPRLVWYVDQPERTAEVPYHSMDYCVAVSEGFFDEIKRRGGKVLGVLPAACRPEFAKPLFQPAWKHQVSYVGSVNDQNHINRQLNQETQTWISTIAQQQIEDPYTNLDQIISKNPLKKAHKKELLEILTQHFSKARYMTQERLIEYFLFVEANAVRRVQIIASLQEHEFFEIGALGIYGPSDWKNLLPTEELKKCYQGPIESAIDLEDLYQSSKINLSLNSLLGFNFVNPRLFEVPAAGGFLLAEYVPHLESFFEKDKEMLWFISIEELHQKITEALTDDGYRLAMISRAQHRLEQEHTYKHRAQTVLEYFKKKL